MPFDTTNPLVIKPSPYLPVEMIRPDYGVVNFIHGIKDVPQVGMQWISNKSNFLLEIMKFMPSLEAQLYKDPEFATPSQRWEYTRALEYSDNSTSAMLDNNYGYHATTASFGLQHSQIETWDGEKVIAGSDAGEYVKDFEIGGVKGSFDFLPAFFDFFHTNDGIKDINFFTGKEEFGDITRKDCDERAKEAYGTGTVSNAIEFLPVPVFSPDNGSNTYTDNNMALLEQVTVGQNTSFRQRFFPTDYNNMWFGTNPTMLKNNVLPNIASISQDLFLEAVNYFKNNGIYSFHNGTPNTEPTPVEQSFTAYYIVSRLFNFVRDGFGYPITVTSDLWTSEAIQVKSFIYDHIIPYFFEANAFDPATYNQTNCHPRLFKSDINWVSGFPSMDDHTWVVDQSSVIRNSLKTLYDGRIKQGITSLGSPERVYNPSFYQLVKDPTAPWNQNKYNIWSETQNGRSSDWIGSYTGRWSSVDGNGLNDWWESKSSEWGKIAFYLSVIMLESRRRYFSAMTELFGPFSQFKGFSRSDQLNPAPVRDAAGRILYYIPDDNYDVTNNESNASTDFLMIKWMDKWIGNKYTNTEFMDTWLSKDTGNTEKLLFQNIAQAQHRLTQWTQKWRDSSSIGWNYNDPETAWFRQWILDQLTSYKSTYRDETAAVIDPKMTVMSNNFLNLQAVRDWSSRSAQSVVDSYNTYISSIKYLDAKTGIKLGSYLLDKYDHAYKQFITDNTSMFNSIDSSEIVSYQVVEGDPPETVTYYRLSDDVKAGIDWILPNINHATGSVAGLLYGELNSIRTAADNDVLYQLRGELFATGENSLHNANYHLQTKSLPGLYEASWDYTAGHFLGRREINGVQVNPQGHFYSPLAQMNGYTIGESWAGYTGVERLLDTLITWSGSPVKYDYPPIYKNSSTGDASAIVWMTHAYGTTTEAVFGICNTEGMVVLLYNRQEKKKYDNRLKRYTDQKEEDYWNFIAEIRSQAKQRENLSLTKAMYRRMENKSKANKQAAEAISKKRRNSDKKK